MSSPRKRPIRLAPLVLTALLTGWTVHSLDAAPRRTRSAGKNPSSSVQQKARRKKGSITASPRPIAAPGRASLVKDGELRKAVALREAWNGPRRSFLGPAPVEEPSAVVTKLSAHREATPGAREKQAAPDRPGSLQARNSPVREEAPSEDVIREALRNRGKPYVWGGSSRSGFDCSGFICYLFYKERGIKLPHSAAAQSRHGTPVRSSELQAGDLLFFSTYRPGISHVGIYVGSGRFIHAANRRKDVRVDPLAGYYSRRLKAARRIAPKPLRFSPADLKSLQESLEASEIPGG